MKTLVVAGGLSLFLFISPSEAIAFTVEAPLRKGGPQLQVSVAEQQSMSNWHYAIHVTTSDGLDQQFAIRNGQSLTPKDVRLVDVNADGYLDIMIVGGKDHRGQEWFKTWLYDSKAKRYRWINDPVGGP